MKDAKNELLAFADTEKAVVLQRFFKTNVGEYGYGDIFIGVTVPQTRAVAKKYIDISLEDVVELAHDEIHEVRLLALLILVERYKKCKHIDGKREIVELYLSITDNINNWDLVDLSCYFIVGDFTHLNGDIDTLIALAHSDNMWEQRVAIVSTMMWLRRGDCRATVTIAQLLLTHSHDLIHKAVGWLLREMGKRDKALLIEFLNSHHALMARTMLRYAIEKFDDTERKFWLSR